MIAAGHFVSQLSRRESNSIIVDLYGSLALMGKGHATDTAAVLRLLRQTSNAIELDAVLVLLDAQCCSGVLELGSGLRVPLQPEVDIVFRKRQALLRHVNGMAFTATGPNELVWQPDLTA